MRLENCFKSLAGLLACALLVVPAVASAERIQAELDGYQEVPAVSTAATGSFRAMISPSDDAISFELSYTGLQGNVTQAHVHFAQTGVNGGIAFWLCGTATNPGPAGTPTCPTEGTVTGLIMADDVVGPGGQLIAAGDLAAVIAAIRAGATYANVHSTLVPAGEIRGQIRGSARR